VIISNDMRGGTDYSVRSRIPTMSFEELDRAPRTGDAALARYLLLPPTPEIARVQGIAEQIVERADARDGSPFRQAVALQDFLRTFAYDEDVALAHNIDDIESFLVDIQRGYCEQFATAMAVMARTLGLPSRVAIGFAVGTTGVQPDEYEVTSRHAHAWVEIWMSGFGWVTFEPTPRGDALLVPRYTTPAAAPSNPATSPTPSAEESPDASASPSAPGAERFDETPGAGSGVSGGRRLIQVGTLAGILLVLALFALPIAARTRRVVRYRRAGTAEDKVSARYLDFLDWCATVGLGRGPGETPMEHAQRLAKASSDSGSSLDGLARIGTDAVYAPVNGIEPAAAAKLSRDARRSISTGLPRRARLLGRVGWAWWRTDPEGGGTPWSRMRAARFDP
jgi:hypothetical protein